jgi:5-methylcytosine-specific restriction endonuclease McrA
MGKPILKLQRIPDRLKALDTRRLPVLETKAGSTPRISGSKWMGIHRRVLLAGEFRCVDCGTVGLDNQIDHDIPLEQGGSNDDANLRIRCIPCHAAKTKSETQALFGKQGN